MGDLLGGGCFACGKSGTEGKLQGCVLRQVFERHLFREGRGLFMGRKIFWEEVFFSLGRIFSWEASLELEEGVCGTGEKNQNAKWAWEESLLEKKERNRGRSRCELPGKTVLSLVCFPSFNVLHHSLDPWTLFCDLLWTSRATGCFSWMWLPAYTCSILFFIIFLTFSLVNGWTPILVWCLMVI